VSRAWTAEDGASRILAGIAKFHEEMHEQGIHVGVDGRCACCGKAWPCPAAEAKRRRRHGG
jgi:hypothetical protein